MRPTTLPTLVLLGALALAGCGGSDEVAAPTGSDTTAPAETATPTETASPTETATPTEPASPTETAPAQAADCSGATVDVEVVDRPDLPAEVDAQRRFLTDAALRCDEQLIRTAVEESSQFTYSFGESGDVVGFLRDQEEQGEPVYAYLAELLQTTPALADGGEVYVWPRVLTDRPEDTTDEAWAELVPIFGEARTQELRTGGDGMYLYWRVGIATDGEFRFFVSGD